MKFLNGLFLLIVDFIYFETLIRLEYSIVSSDLWEKKLKILLKKHKLYSSEKDSNYLLFVSRTSKEDLIIKFKNYSNNSRILNNASLDSTSGSTGDATYFYTDKKRLSIRHAYADYGDSFSGWKFGEPKFILWGAERDIKNSLKKRLANSNFLFNTKIVSSYYMFEEDMNKYISEINKFKPTLIIGYPSSLDYFSSYIKISNELTHFPKAVITSGETLFDEQRFNIENTFNCKVYNRYGCREVGIIASECEEHNGLHIHSSHVIVEVVDEFGIPCKPGEIGEILVTDLDNLVFPIVRYQIGDLGIISDRKCKCGRSTPILEKVIGRSFDLIVGTNGNHVPGTFFTIFLKKVKGILTFQLIQRVNLVIDLKLVVDSFYNSEERDKLIDELKQKLGENTVINIEVVEKIEKTKGGKHRFIISELNEEKSKS